MTLDKNDYPKNIFTKGDPTRRKNKSLFFILWLLFCFASNPLYAQTKINDYPIIKSLQNLPLDSSFIWMDEFEYTSNDSTLAVAHAIGLQTLGRAYSTKEDSIIAKANLMFSDWHGNTMAFSGDSILFYKIKAVEYYTKTRNQQKIALHSTTLAKDYLFMHEYKKGQETIFSALKIYETLGDEQGIAEAFRILSAFAIEMDEPLQSIKYADKAIDLFEKLKDYKSMARVYLGTITAYQELEQYDKAYQVATDCINIMEIKAPLQINPIGKIVLGKNTSDKDIIGGAYCERGDISIIKKNYEQALEDYTKAWQLSVEQYGVEVSGGWQSQVGIAYRLLGRYDEALEHLLIGNKTRERTGGHLLRFYLETAKCYKQMGNYPMALEYQEKSIAEKDRIHKGKIANLASEAIVKYETEKKDQALAVQKDQLLQKNKIQNLTMGIVALLATLLFALLYSFRKNKKINAQLNIKNKENELLLKEIHHRVKNNLQTISSLLSLQSESINDKKAYDAVTESKNRVTSMALIHQKLYQGENLAAIEMRDYFETIGMAIIDSFGEKAKNISLDIDMSEIELDVDTAVPIGLITNELITNSIKHAFPSKEKGQILITLNKKNGILKLQISDNGQGTPTTLVTKKENGFGTLLIQLLTTQLGGTLEKTTESGTTTIIEFPQQEKSVA